MPLFTVTNGPRVLTVRAACRMCARRVAVEYIALTGPTASWRDPQVTKVALAGSDDGKKPEVVSSSYNGYAIAGVVGDDPVALVGEQPSEYLVPADDAKLLT